MFDEFEVISQYTRTQAIEDGELIDVSSLAQEAGFRFPIAITRASWVSAVELPHEYNGCQDEGGRLWDVLNVLRFEIRRSSGKSVINFKVSTLNVETNRQETISLKSICQILRQSMGEQFHE